MQAETMQAIDDALEPVRRMASTPQPMNTSMLGSVAAAVRQALAIMVYGPPEPVPQSEHDAPLVGEQVTETPVAEAPVVEPAADASEPEAPVLTGEDPAP